MYSVLDLLVKDSNVFSDLNNLVLFQAVQYYSV